MAQARRFAIERGGKALEAMTFIERSAMLKAVARYLLEQKAALYTISAETGATRADSWVDIEGALAPFSPTPVLAAASCRTIPCGRKMS